MDKIKVAILKGRRELSGSSGVDFFILKLYEELKKTPHLDINLIYGNYVFPGIFKFLHFNNLDRYDIIHNPVPGLGMFVRTRKPILTTVYDDAMFNPRMLIENLNLSTYQKYKFYLIKKLWSFGVTYDISRSKKIVAVSKETKLSYEKRFPNLGKIEVIPPGIETNIFKPLANVKKNKNKNNLRLFYCGRLCFRKGIDVLLDTLLILKNKHGHKNFKLFLAGTVDPNFNLVDEINKRGLGDSVAYLGAKTPEELAVEYNLSDIFVFPSRLDSYGIPPIEALSCGIKVVSSNIPSVNPFPEIIKVETTAESITEGILRAIDKSINLKLVQVKIEKNYSIKAIGASYLNLYKKMLSKKITYTKYAN